jgi:hypothetical protein
VRFVVGFVEVEHMAYGPKAEALCMEPGASTTINKLRRVFHHALETLNTGRSDGWDQNEYTPGAKSYGACRGAGN